MGERGAGLRAAGVSRGRQHGEHGQQDETPSSQGPGDSPPATPVGTLQETRLTGQELGRKVGQQRLSLARGARRLNSTHLAWLLPQRLPRRIRSEVGHAAHDVRGLRRPCRRARPQACHQRRPGAGPQARRRAFTLENLQWLCSRATGARPSSTAVLHVISESARWTGVERYGLGD